MVWPQMARYGLAGTLGPQVDLLAAPFVQVCGLVPVRTSRSPLELVVPS